MGEIETISWKDLTGNKYNKTLHPAMLSEQGYIKQTSVRRVGEKGKTIFNVVYDRDYVIEYLEKTVFLKLFTLNTDTLADVLVNAFCKVRKDVSPICLAAAMKEQVLDEQT